MNFCLGYKHTATWVRAEPTVTLCASDIALRKSDRTRMTFGFRKSDVRHDTVTW